VVSLVKPSHIVGRRQTETGTAGEFQYSIFLRGTGTASLFCRKVAIPPAGCGLRGTYNAASSRNHYNRNINKTPTSWRPLAYDPRTWSCTSYAIGWQNSSNFIEIPGQYGGDFKPIIEQHVKIVRVESRLKVFSSKRMPIEVKIHGSDGKTYNFIIKFGKDLRQDQRIQQVLRLMSRHLSLDRNCYQNRLKIDTYQVIPVNASCGMLSVVSNSTTISDYIDNITKPLIEPSFREILSNVRMQYEEFLKDGRSIGDWSKVYENAILNIDREELLHEFGARQSYIPQSSMRDFLKASALSLERFYILRRNFITSLVTMNIAHWLLGIGDRHLSNILIDLKSGRLIGIDFGIAFGAAAGLAVPELVPFHLTSHFVNVLEPTGIEGVVKRNMAHVLRALRNYSSTIMICLEMFIKEPTIDWLKKSKLKSADDGEGKTSLPSTSQWDPEARIAMAKRKLNGANPATITKDELTMGKIAHNPKLLETYREIADGVAGNERRKVGAENLTVEQQVNCLVEMAMDPQILATIWIGWNPYF